MNTETIIPRDESYIAWVLRTVNDFGTRSITRILPDLLEAGDDADLTPDDTYSAKFTHRGITYGWRTFEQRWTEVR